MTKFQKKKLATMQEISIEQFKIRLKSLDVAGRIKDLKVKGGR